MKRLAGASVLVVAILLLVPAGPALAQGFMAGDDPLMVLPDVFVIIDTSGSMGSCCYPCGVGGTQWCSRVTATRQVLTGTYLGAVGSCASQMDDGILDSYKEHIRFAFATFDDDRPCGCGVCRGSNTWNYPAWGSGDSKASKGQMGIKGRGAAGGGLIDFIDPANPEDQLANNTRIQQAACQTNASGCTPLNASLWDARYYYNNWENETGYDDPLSACRPKFVLLMTDGDNNGPASYGYTTPPGEAALLLGEGIPTFVVAFGGGSAGAHAIALAGSGGLLMAFTANDPATLFIAFSAILDAILAGTSSRTEMVSSGSEASLNATHQYAAWFEITMSGMGWTGHLVQLPIIGILPTGLPIYGPVGDRIYFEDELAAMSHNDRKIYTVINDPRSQDPSLFNWNIDDGGFDNTNLPRYFDDGQPDRGLVSFKAGTHHAQTLPWMCQVDSEGLGDLTLSNRIKDWVRGVPGTPSVGDKYFATGPVLGDIFHSTPAVVKRPSALTPDYRYELYYRNNYNRDTMVYVGANDGMLHAFVAEDIDNSGDLGEEAWAFIPTNLLAKIQKTRYTHEKFVDGSPVVRDVYFNNIMSKYPDNSDYALGAYRSVLISGERGGGDAYFALDVTDPHNPGYLWEYRTGVPVSIDYAAAQCSPSKMETWSKPVVGQVWLKNENPTAPENAFVSRSVMIVPGGYISPQALMNVPSCIDLVEMMIGANSLHVVDVETGRLLRRFLITDTVGQGNLDLLDQFYAELADCTVNGNCNSWNHWGAGNNFGAADWDCSEKRASVENSPIVPPELVEGAYCTITDDDNVYRKECCYNPSSTSCHANGLTSCYYFYEKKKDVPGGLTIIIKTEGCALVPDHDQRGRLEVNIADDYFLESVASKPAVYNTTLGEFITRVFVGTTSGKVWRVDMNNALYNGAGKESPANDTERLIKEYTFDSTDFCWDMGRQDEDSCNPAKAPVPWFDMVRDDPLASGARPIMVDPVLALDYNRELLLLFGTGYTDNLQYTNTNDYFYSVREAHKPATFELEPIGQIASRKTLPNTAERLFGRPLVAAGNVFFTTYVPIDDECLPGYARMYGWRFADFDDPGNPIAGQTLAGTVGTPSAPSMAITEHGPVVVVQQGANVTGVKVDNVIKPTAQPLHWGKVL
jgi:hypothetical protein